RGWGEVEGEGGGAEEGGGWRMSSLSELANTSACRRRRPQRIRKCVRLLAYKAILDTGHLTKPGGLTQCSASASRHPRGTGDAAPKPARARGRTRLSSDDLCHAGPRGVPAPGRRRPAPGGICPVWLVQRDRPRGDPYPLRGGAGRGHRAPPGAGRARVSERAARGGELSAHGRRLPPE